MADEKEKLEKQYNADRDEAIKLLLQSSLVYALKIHNFDAEKYFIEDVTSVLADYQTLILKGMDELIEGSFAVMKEFGEKYSAR
jgi:hypothetical protein